MRAFYFSGTHAEISFGMMVFGNSTQCYTAP